MVVMVTLLSFSCLVDGQCPEGTTGSQCDSCLDGYYGDPNNNIPCQKCNCSGNINLTDTGNCNNKNGKCLKCLNNTDGFNCHICIDGYYGDAVNGECIREYYNQYYESVWSSLSS